MSDFHRYKVLWAYSPEKLEKEVQQYMAQGWQPSGGISVGISSYEHERRTGMDPSDVETDTHTDELFSQAMVKMEYYTH